MTNSAVPVAVINQISYLGQPSCKFQAALQGWQADTSSVCCWLAGGVGVGDKGELESEGGMAKVRESARGSTRVREGD